MFYITQNNLIEKLIILNNTKIIKMLFISNNLEEKNILFLLNYSMNVDFSTDCFLFVTPEKIFEI